MPSAPSQTTSIRPSPPRRRPRPTTARGPRLGVIASLALHALGVAAIFFAFHHGFTPPEESHAVPVDLITIAAVTNVAAAAPPPAPEQPVKRDLPPLEPPPVPDMVQAEPAPDVKPPKFEIEKPRPDTRQDISHLLDQLTAPQKPARNARNAPVATQSAGLANAMTASLADALRSQIRPCWHPILGAPNPADQIVRFALHLNPDGTVASLETLTMGGNSYTSAAVLAASRAIYECQQAPGRTGYQLPPQSYSQWREFNPLTFDPRQMQQ